MHFQFTELQQSVQRMMKEFVDREVMPIAMEYELADKYPTPVVEKMQELGFFGFTIPEEYGGSGMDEVCYAIAMEELSVGWMSVAGILGTHMMTAWMLLNYGTDEQKKDLPAENGHRRVALGHGAHRAGFGIGCRRSQDARGARRRPVGDERLQDVHLERRARHDVQRVRAYRSGKAQGEGHLLHPRPQGNARFSGEQASQEDGLPGHPHERTGLRGRARAARESARRGERGLPDDHERTRGRPRERGGAQRGPRPRGIRGFDALFPAARDLRQAAGGASADPGETRRDGNAHPRGEAHDVSRREPESPGQAV